MTSLVTECVHFLPQHPARDQILQVGLLLAQWTFPVLALNDLVAGAVVTRGPGAARHHHCVTQQLLADGTQQLFRDGHLD